MDFTRQMDLLNNRFLGKLKVTLIGAGAIGSFTALTITKMGVINLTIYDQDGVSEHNLPNQFFRIKDTHQFKIDCLQNIIHDFTGVTIKPNIRYYTKQKLGNVVIVATDSMSSRKLVWEQFLKQPQCHSLIEARMGAELGIVYTIRRLSNIVIPIDIKFYEDKLYSDKQAKQLPCTAKAIIYNVLMIASLICRSLKAVVSNEPIPREMVFGMTNITDHSFMIRS